MRELLIGLAAAFAFAFVNGVIVSGSGEHSLLFIGIFGVIPVDWLLIGAWMGMAVGFSHRGVHAADHTTVFISGAAASVFCTFLTHAVQFGAIVGGWDINSFIAYLGIYGKAWEIGEWYVWLALPLAALTGGATAVGVSSEQRADNIRAKLPAWVPPTSRILIHIARADGNVDADEAALIVGLLRAQMIKTLPEIPGDLDAALADVIRAETDAIKEGRTIDHDLKEKCFKSSAEQRESTAMLAIAVAQADGVVGEEEARLLNKMITAWDISPARGNELAVYAFDEFAQVL